MGPTWRVASDFVSRVHRLGSLVTCLFFVLWFASGAILLFVPFPTLTEQERFTWQEPIAVEARCVSIGEGWAALQQPSVMMDEVRLVSTAGRPLYLFELRDGRVEAVWADTGMRIDHFTAEQAARAVETALPRYEPAHMDQVTDDQWTVHQRFDRHRPLYRMTLPDERGRQVYVSSRTGEVVLDTTRRERFWNSFGAVTHWLYWPVLRRHREAWNQVVWWVAALGVLTALSGLIVGTIRSAGVQSWSKAVMRWHYRVGLVIGGLLLTWVFSGLLSMDNGRWFSPPGLQPRDRDLLHGAPPDSSRLSIRPSDVLRRMGSNRPVREIVTQTIGGQIVVIVRFDEEEQLILHPPDWAAGAKFLNQETVLAAARQLRPAHLQDVVRLERGDFYYYPTMHNPRPFPVTRIRFDDRLATWAYVDLRTGRLVEMLDRGQRVHRWLFHGLHSWDLPVLQDYPRSRQAVLSILCLVGVGFSLTGAWLALASVWRTVHKP